MTVVTALANGYVEEPGAPGALRLFCFHHAGGGSSLYRGWQRAIGPHVTVCPVLLPGRERRAGQPRFTELGELVADLDAQLGDLLAEPHAFFGHSMGALVAYRLACLRRARAGQLPRALLVSAYPAPHLAAPLPTVDVCALAGLLAGIGGLPAQALDVPAELLAVVQDDLRLCAGHREVGEAPLPCPVHVFGADGDPLVGEQDLWAWQRHAAQTVDVRIVSGDHFSIRDEPEQLLAHLRPLLRRYL